MKNQWLLLFISVAILGSCFGVMYKKWVQGKPYIAVVLQQSNSEYWKSIEAGANTAFKNIGVKGNVYILGKKENDQMAQLRKILTEKPDALIVSPVNPNITESILKEYHQKHVPVLLIDQNVNGSDPTAFIGTDNVLLGQKAGELLSSMMQPGDKVALIGLPSNQANSFDRLQGAKESLSAAGMDIVIDKKVSGIHNLQPVMKNILQHDRDLKGVFASNDELAIKVSQLSKKAGMDLSVIGAEGTAEMLKYIQKGDIKGTISQNPYEMGYLSVDYAFQAIKGKRVEKRINSGVDIITQDNVDSKLNFLEANLASEQNFTSQFQ